MKKSGAGRVENRRGPYVSPGVQGTARRFKPGTFTKIMSGYLIAVSALLLGLMLLQQRGYHLIKSAITYYLLVAAVAGVLLWVVIGARKLVRRDALKKTMTVSLAVLSGVVMIYVLSIASAYINYINTEVGRSTSPGGENRLVILRSYYIDIERMADDVRGEHPDYTDEQVDEALSENLRLNPGTDMYSYVYVAYPIRGGIFYYTDVEVGPELLIVAQDSEAELRVKWEDENTATLYAGNPGEYDRGKFTVKCK